MIIYALLLVFVSSDFVQGQGTCDRLPTCMQQLVNVTHKREPPLFTLKTKEEFSQFCSNFERSVKTCLSPVPEKCSVPQQQQLLDVFTATDFQCSRDSVFRQKFDCFISPKFINDIRGCRDSYKMKSKKYGHTCRVFKDIFNCGSRAAGENCGIDFAHFIEEYFVKLTATNMSAINCVVQEKPACPGGKTLVSCVDPVLEHFFRGLPIVTIGTENDLNEFCSKVDAIGTCVKGIKTSCPASDESFIKKKFDGMRKSGNFMCGTGKADFVKHQSCLTGETNKAAFRSCYDKLKSEAKDISGDDDKCHVFNKAIKCSTDAASKNCNSEAEEFVRKWMLEMTSNHLSGISCPTGGANVMTYSWMGLLLCVVVYALF